LQICDFPFAFQQHQLYVKIGGAALGVIRLKIGKSKDPMNSEADLCLFILLIRNVNLIHNLKSMGETVEKVTQPVIARI